MTATKERRAGARAELARAVGELEVALAAVLGALRALGLPRPSEPPDNRRAGGEGTR